MCVHGLILFLAYLPRKIVCIDSRNVSNKHCQGFFMVWFKGTPRNFMRSHIFSKMFKIIPKRIVYYSIKRHSAQLVLLYLQKFQHKFFNFNFTKQLLFISECIGFLLVICRFYGLQCSLCHSLFYPFQSQISSISFIHFSHKFHERSQARLSN